MSPLSTRETALRSAGDARCSWRGLQFWITKHDNTCCTTTRAACPAAEPCHACCRDVRVFIAGTRRSSRRALSPSPPRTLSWAWRLRLEAWHAASAIREWPRSSTSTPSRLASTTSSSSTRAFRWVPLVYLPVGQSTALDNCQRRCKWSLRTCYPVRVPDSLHLSLNTLVDGIAPSHGQ